MKPIKLKLLTVLTIIIGMSATAQINSGPGYMHGSYKKGDTITEYTEDPKKHEHPKVTIIKKTQTEEGLKLQAAEKAKHGDQPAVAVVKDTQPAQDTTPVDVTSTTTSTEVPIAVTNTNDNSDTMCFSKKCVYTALAGAGVFSLLFLWLLLLLFRRNRKESKLS